VKSNSFRREREYFIVLALGIQKIMNGA